MNPNGMAGQGGLATESYRFDDIVVDAAAHTLSRAGIPQTVEPKAFAVLLKLLRRAGELVGRDELLDEVWGHRHVTPGVLTRVIAQLRHALGDDSQRPRYIQTQHALGYRFIGQLKAGPTPNPGRGEPAAGPSRRRIRSKASPRSGNRCRRPLNVAGQRGRSAGARSELDDPAAERRWTGSIERRSIAQRVDATAGRSTAAAGRVPTVPDPAAGRWPRRRWWLAAAALLVIAAGGYWFGQRMTAPRRRWRRPRSPCCRSSASVPTAATATSPRAWAWKCTMPWPACPDCAWSRHPRRRQAAGRHQGPGRPARRRHAARRQRPPRRTAGADQCPPVRYAHGFHVVGP